MFSHELIELPVDPFDLRQLLGSSHLILSLYWACSVHNQSSNSNTMYIHVPVVHHHS